MEELWKAVPGWEGFYEASSLGRVRSIDRTVMTRKHGPTFYRGRLLSLKGSKSGYQIVTFTKPGQKPICKNIHSVILETFVGPPPEGMECCHGPGGAQDNRLVNLRWDTRKENAADYHRRGFTQRGLDPDLISSEREFSLRDWRSSLEWTQARAASHLGFSTGGYGWLERKGNPFAEIVRACRHLSETYQGLEYDL